ncbi:MAG: hypothetical protein CVV41_12200 [Candidatus Riflebacteria bacterium HGW-Riflebacteria-1]|jgi:hypothetical protein|nr:MAG: hypothetical protein CVV41_12200 [Candidatus Riflebacteria bacterium HGW-Riflebacteria-1]
MMSYLTIAQFLLTTALSFGNWKNIIYGAFNPIALMTAYLLLAVQIRSCCNWLLPWVILVMITAYFFADLITPHDLDWHLRTSCNSLFMQLWPLKKMSIFTRPFQSGEVKECFISD